MKSTNDEWAMVGFDLIRRRWRQSHIEYHWGPSDLNCRNRHWQILESCEKALYSLLDKRLVGSLVSIPLNDICEEMVRIHRYRMALLRTWLAATR